MSFLEELDRVLEKRLLGTPGATLRALGSLSRVSYVARIGTMHADIGTMIIDKITDIGTINYNKRTGTIGHIAAGSLGRVERVGYTGSLQTVSYISRQGTLHQIDRVGSAHIESGSVDVNIAAQAITVGVDVQARYSSPVAMRDRIRLGPGSTWTGSWVPVDDYRVKSLMTQLWGNGTVHGSLSIIVGMTGTKASDGTFTYYQTLQAQGSPGQLYSFEEAVQYIRPKIYRHGGPGSWIPEKGGTVSCFLGRQV